MDKEVGQYLIINADDFGYSKERDEGILECFWRGAISSATVLINAMNAKDGIHKAQQVGLPIGLHLNLTEGKPVGTGSYKTLIGANGSFLGKLGFRELVKTGKVSIREVIEEIQCQIDWFRKYANISPTHVDGHQHVHVIPGRYSMKQYMPSKPIKRGFKIWMRCDAESGYCHALDLYMGKHDPNRGPQLSQKVVKLLVNDLKGKNHHIFFDRFFTSVNLLQILERNGIYACGTIKQNSEGVAEVFASVLADNHINMTRLPLEMDIPVHKWGSPEKAKFMVEVVENAEQALHVFRSHGIWTPSFLGLKTMGQDMSVEFLQKLLIDTYPERIKAKTDQAVSCEISVSSDETDINVCTSDGTTTTRSQTFCESVAGNLSKIGSDITDVQVCEFMVHPGYRTRQTGGCGEGPDCFSQSSDREHEMAVLCDPRMTEFYTDFGIKLISFCDAAKLISHPKFCSW